MPTYLLLDPSSINALIIITLLFEILTLLHVVRSFDSILYEPVLNKIAALWKKSGRKAIAAGVDCEGNSESGVWNYICEQ
ncbi:MAG: hypothetical protein V7K68_24790 [Nostoc sp.]|uniref:hypothetical protein n=1 Tax=Nostoc sp. TaxID=1180 RepID=UPI002FF8598E